MSSLLITTNGETWLVWIGLDGEDPFYETGFVIGVGTNRERAVDSAVADLERAARRLRGDGVDIRTRRT